MSHRRSHGRSETVACSSCWGRTSTPSRNPAFSLLPLTIPLRAPVMSPNSVRAIPAALLWTLAACAPSAPSANAPPMPAPSTTADPSPADGAKERARRRNRNFLSAEEIQANFSSDALQAVQRLRPLWLRKRPGVGDDGTEIVVYYNSQRFGSPVQLRQVEASKIVSMEYIPSIPARSRFGAGHGLGVIWVEGH